MFCYHLSSASTKKCLIRHDTATSTYIQLVKPTTKLYLITNKITKVLPAAGKAIRGGTMRAKYKK